MTISGVFTAMVTPFERDGAVDLDAARRLARHLVDNGSHGLVVAGTTGESPTLTDDEKLRLLDAVIDEVARARDVICGTGSNDTRHSVELTRAAAEVGADAVLVVTPYYNKPNRAGLRAHFEAVAEAAGETPVILYNIPSRSVINLPPDLLAELAAEIDNVVAVKQANDDELGPIEGLDVLAGNDAVFLRCLELGGAGGILVARTSSGPEMRAIYEAASAGDDGTRAGARRGAAADLRGDDGDREPDPGQGGARDAGGHRGPPAAADGARDDQERAAIRTALERRGLLVAGGSSAERRHPQDAFR